MESTNRETDGWKLSFADAEVGESTLMGLPLGIV